MLRFWIGKECRNESLISDEKPTEFDGTGRFRKHGLKRVQVGPGLERLLGIDYLKQGKIIPIYIRTHELEKSDMASKIRIPFKDRPSV